MNRNADKRIRKRYLAGSILIGTGTFALLGLGEPFLAVAVLTTFAAVASMLTRPAVAGAVLAATSVANAASVLTEFYGIPSITEPLMALAVLSIAISSIRSAISVQLPQPALVLALGGYVAVQLASIFWADDPVAATGVTVGTIRDILIALVVVATIGSVGDLLVVIGGIASAGVFLAALSVHQAITGSYSSPYGGFAVATIEQIVGEVDDWRASGPFDDPNFFAQVLVVAFSLSLVCAVFSQSRRARMSGLAGAVVSGFGVVVTFSRGGTLALLAVCVCVVALRRPRPIWTMAAIAIVLVSAAALPSDFTSRVTQSTAGLPLVGGDQPIADSAVRGRASEGIVGLQMFVDHPLVGVGAGNYAVNYQDYSRELGLDPRRQDRKSHNVYVEIASETGLL
ncbi:MAG: O-antigen ligase family protein, partial [Ilumatobacter sp.]